MSSLGRLTVWAGFGNILSLEPKADVDAGEALDMSGATKVQVCLAGGVYDSDEHSDKLYWEDDGGTWVIHMKLGLLPDLEPGDTDMVVVVFDGDYPNGVVLPPPLPLTVEGVCQ